MPSTYQSMPYMQRFYKDVYGGTDFTRPGEGRSGGGGGGGGQSPFGNMGKSKSGNNWLEKLTGAGGLGMEENAYTNFGTDKAVDLSGAYGGGESGGEAAGGEGILGYVIAAIYAQHELSKATDRKTEGQPTEDVFSGNFTTEPWYAYMRQQFGWDDPTAGEKFDASVEQGDWGNAAARSIPVAQYWGDPAGTWLYDSSKEVLGEEASAVIFPDHWAGEKISEWLEGVF